MTEFIDVTHMEKIDASILKNDILTIRGNWPPETIKEE